MLTVFETEKEKQNLKSTNYLITPLKKNARGLSCVEKDDLLKAEGWIRRERNNI